MIHPVICSTGDSIPSIGDGNIILGSKNAIRSGPCIPPITIIPVIILCAKGSVWSREMLTPLIIQIEIIFRPILTIHSFVYFPVITGTCHSIQAIQIQVIILRPGGSIRTWPFICPISQVLKYQGKISVCIHTPVYRIIICGYNLLSLFGKCFPIHNSFRFLCPIRLGIPSQKSIILQERDREHSDGFVICDRFPIYIAMGVLGMERNTVLIGGPMSVIGRILMWYVSFFRNPSPSIWFRIKTQEGISLADKFRKCPEFPRI